MLCNLSGTFALRAHVELGLVFSLPGQFRLDRRKRSNPALPISFAIQRVQHGITSTGELGSIRITSYGVSSNRFQDRKSSSPLG